MPCCEHEAGPNETRTRSPEEWLEYSSRNTVRCSTVHKTYRHKTYRPTQKCLQPCSPRGPLTSGPGGSIQRQHPESIADRSVRDK
jgi:hypothetical protein